MADTIRVRITDQPIDSAALLRGHGASHHGALVSFFGVVRDTNLGRTVTGIEYDAFVPLAEQTFRAFCAEAQANWGEDMHVTIVHRIGSLGIGDISVALLVSTRHRAEAYEISRYIIEELKHRSPIWKKEHYSDGSSDWVQGHALCQHDHGSIMGWREAQAGHASADEPDHHPSRGTGVRV
ncbi:molybdenum cofactor biosynthesis protein MoaE [Oligoflexus tunisiensis]|uniref:molybdenum cofactor biosynthesis protein MoaE n=1 Tax=Oligoflexus tunisiensis TaxID=708132 RepID=UPI00114D302E|nr:molybdenum cofactor biosynthesis protein MoaE [Oligoflexus tunisiensis]